MTNTPRYTPLNHSRFVGLDLRQFHWMPSTIVSPRDLPGDAIASFIGILIALLVGLFFIGLGVGWMMEHPMHLADRAIGIFSIAFGASICAAVGGSR